MADPLLSIIMPAYNEEGSIRQTIEGIKALNLPQSEILVVDDASTDDTAQVAKDCNAVVISHPYNIGNGAAIKTGIRSARGLALVFLDADGQHNPADIPKLVAHIARFHMVVGARDKGSEAYLHRRIANWIYNRLSTFVAGFNIQDLTSGFRVMRRQDALRFCDMLPNTFSYPTTSTLAFLRSGRTIKYVPIQARHRQGKSKIRLIHDGFEFLIIIVKIVMSFSPLRVFLPLSSFLFFLGVGRYIYTYLTYQAFTNMSHLLINSSLIVFVLGLIAEQIASLRLEKGDNLAKVEDQKTYEVFEALVR